MDVCGATVAGAQVRSPHSSAPNPQVKKGYYYITYNPLLSYQSRDIGVPFQVEWKTILPYIPCLRAVGIKYGAGKHAVGTTSRLSLGTGSA